MENRRMGGPSGLPVPSYASQTPQRQSRLGRMRQSLGGTHAQASNPFIQADVSMNGGIPQPHLTQSALRMPSSSVRRQSTRPGGQGNPLLASVQQTPGLAMRTPMRQPAAMSAPGSVAPKSTIPRTQYLMDDRPLRERAHQSIMLKAINDFLREQGKDTVLRGHPTPSAKEFQDTFLFIYNISFEDDRTPGSRKMDEEVVELLRAVRYPWVDALAKLSFSIITPHVWPQLLGSLHWMVAGYEASTVGYTGWVEEGKDQNLVDDNDMDEASADAPFDAARLLRLFLFYLGDVWLDYCSHKDDFSAHRANFMSIFETQLEQERETVDSYQETLLKLKTEATALKHGEDAEKRLREEIAELDASLDQCQEVKRGTLNKIRGQREASAKLDLEIQAVEDKIAPLNRAIALLSEDVKRQNLSPEEVARMFRERETLTKQLDDLAAKEIELDKQANELNVPIYNAADNVDTVLEAIDAILYNTNLRPRPPAPFKPSDFLVSFNRATDDLDAMLTGADISPGGEMIMKLSDYAASMRKEKAALASSAVTLENDLEVAATSLEKLRSEVVGIRNSVNLVLKGLTTSKQAWEDDSRASRAHLDTMNMEMMKIKTANQDRGLELSMRLDTLRLTKNETSLKLQRLLTRFIRDLVAKAEELAQLKTWTTSRLESLTSSAKEDDLELLTEFPVADLDALVQRLSLIK